MMRLKAFSVLLVVLILLSACGNNGGNSNAEVTPTTEPSDELVLLGSEKHPEVTIEMSNGKKIVLELYPEVAPNTVNNFVSLINQGFYDGLIFHRVIPDFMIQGGDPLGNGTGGPGYTIKGEFSANGYDNKLKHTRGVISMARSKGEDTAGSQFFIVQGEAAQSLDGLYAAFGKVTTGLDVVDEIVKQERGRNDLPFEPLSMTQIAVDTKGIAFPEPEKM